MLSSCRRNKKSGPGGDLVVVAQVSEDGKVHEPEERTFEVEETVFARTNKATSMDRNE